MPPWNLEGFLSSPSYKRVGGLTALSIKQTAKAIYGRLDGGIYEVRTPGTCYYVCDGCVFKYVPGVQKTRGDYNRWTRKV